MQAVIPNASAIIDDLAAQLGRTMLLRAGYRYADGSMSYLERIAVSTYQTSPRSQGAVNDTVTISGYVFALHGSPISRKLRDVQTRTVESDGRRRVRTSIDLFLRPGHMAIDTDGVAFTVGTIQYFINASSEAMEVISDG